MPVQQCVIKGAPGWKWGSSGKCYTGINARAKAERQGQAARASGFTGNRTRVVASNPLKADPTRTTTLRRMFEQELHRRLMIIAHKVRQLVEIEDAFGLKRSALSHEDEFTVSINEEGNNGQLASHIEEVGVPRGASGAVGEVPGPLYTHFGQSGRQGIDRRRGLQASSKQSGVLNTRWAFRTSSEKVEAFREWIATQVEADILVAATGDIDKAYWTSFVKEGYKKGAGRAFDDVRKPALASGKEQLTFFQGTREEFLRQSFARPVAIEKVKLLAGRVFTDLKGVTEEMSTRMTRTLAEGLTRGQNPRGIARTMIREGIGFTKTRGIQSRALTIARTEIIRAHAEGQLDALERLGVEKVGVMVEWSTAGDDRVCPLCQPLEGVVLKIKEARGIIPRHPNCRCAHIPANVGESKTAERKVDFTNPKTGEVERKLIAPKRGKAKVQKAIDDSVRAELPKRTKRSLAEQKTRTRWIGADKRIAKKRPKSVLE